MGKIPSKLRDEDLPKQIISPDEDYEPVHWNKFIVVPMVLLTLIGCIDFALHASKRIDMLVSLTQVRESTSQNSEDSELNTMILIPEGDFIMGANTGNLDNRPAHRVHTNAYYIDKYLVTNKEYKKFIDATHHAAPAKWVNRNYPTGEDDYPVTFVDWYDATAYAKWAGKRLPTEAEWERAARGDNGYTYPWGNTWDISKLNAEYKYGRTTPVNKFKEGLSPYGCYDMAGNLFQWTASSYYKYRNSPAHPEMFRMGYFVLKGGSWKSDKFSAMSYSRNPTDPTFRSDFFGFRCVKDAR